MPGSTGIELKPQGIGRPVGHPGTHPSDMNAMTKGCLAGPAVCSLLIRARCIRVDTCQPWQGSEKTTVCRTGESSVVFDELREHEHTFRG